MTGTNQPTGQDRLRWLDLARGLAVVSMIIAHTSPWGGILNITEYLSAPWFAFLLGLSLHLAHQRTKGRPVAFAVANLSRGAMLILLGLLLQSIYGQIVVVLQTLGLLTIVLFPLVGLLSRPAVAWGFAAAMALLSPILRDASHAWQATGGSGSPALDYLVDLTAAGHSYRLTSMLAFAAAGIASSGFLGRAASTGRRGLIATAGIGVAAVASYWVGKQTPWGADAYSGSTPEIVGAALLSLAATGSCAWLVDALGPRRARWLDPLVATGRMALTAYTLQILVLAVIMNLWLPGERDDHWWVLLSVIAICVGFCWLWLRRFRTGPLEALIRLPSRWLTRTSDARIAAPRSTD